MQYTRDGIESMTAALLESELIDSDTETVLVQGNHDPANNEAGTRAFAGCENLCYVLIPDTVEMIPDTVETVDESAFEGCAAVVLDWASEATEPEEPVPEGGETVP